MPNILPDCSREIPFVAIVNQSERNAGDFGLPQRRQPLLLHPVEIDGEGQGHRRMRVGPKKAQEPGLDPPRDRRRAGGDQRAVLHLDQGAVIGHQACPQRHQFERQRRFAAAGRAQNDNTAAPEGYGACVQKLRHFLDRKPHDETRAQRLGGDVGLGGANVLGPDHPVMRLDDLFRDR